MADPGILPAACNQLDTIPSSVNRNTSQLMVHLEPVILRTPFGADGIDSWGGRKRKKAGKKGKRKRGGRGERGRKKKKKREPCRGVSMPMFQGCSEICGCRLPAKVVGRLRGEEFPHLEAASSARSAWVRRLCAPRAVIVIEVMLHETNPRFPAVSFLADSNVRISALIESDLTSFSGSNFFILPPKCIYTYLAWKIWYGLRNDYATWKSSLMNNHFDAQMLS